MTGTWVNLRPASTNLYLIGGLSVSGAAAEDTSSDIFDGKNWRCQAQWKTISHVAILPVAGPAHVQVLDAWVANVKVPEVAGEKVVELNSIFIRISETQKKNSFKSPVFSADERHV